MMFVPFGPGQHSPSKCILTLIIIPYSCVARCVLLYASPSRARGLHCHATNHTPATLDATDLIRPVSKHLLPSYLSFHHARPLPSRPLSTLDGTRSSSPQGTTLVEKSPSLLTSAPSASMRKCRRGFPNSARAAVEKKPH
jgi:hypothetical protein